MINEIKELIDYLNDKYGDENLQYKVRETKKYYKITHTSYGQTSSYAFIVKEDIINRALGHARAGAVLKPAGWQTPAKHERGYLFNKSTWDVCFEKYSVAYLR
jgi:hypothetical protein